MNTYRYKSGNAWVGILVLALFLFASFWLVKGVWYLLSFVAPVLLVVTLIINHKVVTNFLKGLWDGIRRDPVAGLLKVALTAIFHPFVMGYLFVKAVAGRSIDKARQRYTDTQQGTLTDYEELETQPGNDNFDIQVPKVIDTPSPKAQPKPQNPYENLFQ